MILKITGEQAFQINATNFTISPAAEDYTLQISADGAEFTDLFNVSSGQTRMITNVANGAYYRLYGNTGEVSINWKRTCGEDDAIPTELSAMQSLPVSANEGTVVATSSGVYQYLNGEWSALGGGGGGSYVLPTASATTLGGVKVGDGLDINAGKLSTQTTFDVTVEQVVDPSTTDFDVFTNEWYNIVEDDYEQYPMTNGNFDYAAHVDIYDESLYITWGDDEDRDESTPVRFADKYQVKMKIVSTVDGVKYVTDYASEIFEGSAFDHYLNMGYLYPHGFDIQIFIMLCGYEADGVTPVRTLIGQASNITKQLVDSTTIVAHKDNVDVELATSEDVEAIDEKIGDINNALQTILG